MSVSIIYMHATACQCCRLITIWWTLQAY